MIDAPWAGVPARFRRFKRRWICREHACQTVTFLEHDERVCAPRAPLGSRAIRWGWPGLVLWTGPGRTLRKWKDALDAYFDADGANNGPTEAINGIIELDRRTARSYRNPTNYQLRMPLIAGGLDASTHTQL